MPRPAVSAEHTRMRKAREARERRERALRAMMAEEDQGNPFVKVIKNQQPPDRFNTAAGQLAPQGGPSAAQDIPVTGEAPPLRHYTDLTFRPQPQPQTGHVRDAKGITGGQPALKVNHTEGTIPIAAPEVSEAGRIDRQSSSQKQLQNILEHANSLEATRAQLRRERELDQLARASRRYVSTNRAKTASHAAYLQQQGSDQRNHLDGNAAISRSGSNTEARRQLLVQIPPLKSQNGQEATEDAIAVAANRPRPATVVSISSTSSRATTPAIESTTPLPAQAPQRAPRKITTSPHPDTRCENDGIRSSREPSGGPEPQAHSPPLLEVRPRTPSSMDEDSPSASPWKLRQQYRTSQVDESNGSGTPDRGQTRDRARESSIPEMEALNLGDKSPLSPTTSEENDGAISPVHLGEPDSEYTPSSPVSLPPEEESEASTGHGFGPDSEPATPTSSRNTSDLFSPSEPTISHMSLLSSPGESNASSQPPSDGYSTPTAGRPHPTGRLRVLDRYLQAIFNQETRGGSDFLAKQGRVYQQVFQTFFDIKCNCTFVPLRMN